MTTEVVNINKSFGDFRALNDINVTINDGEFLAILGPSGCGKTTLLRLLAGFESPTDGMIHINKSLVADRKTITQPEQRNVSMVFQSFALWPHMTVSQHIEFPLKHHRYVDAELRNHSKDRIDEVLKIVELEPFAGRLPGELSGGQKQRVSLARAIAPKPELLLMDEPLSNLDAELRLEMRREIQNLHRLTQAAIVYVTHDQGEALAMADRIIVMNKGHIEQIGSPEEIYHHPKTPFVATFVGKANIFEGTWENNIFTPQGTNEKWKDIGVTKELISENMYALRPEQIELKHAGQNENFGEILTRQFQGKEYHYSVRYNNQTVIVYRPVSEKFRVGDYVSLNPLGNH
ncbi:ABC transporter ATP-binding protein [Salinicoccus hispanicus]|uniref:ATP-binding cassette domain-containing protein n=1 Tax=Salinicoccus hispanicus TaxID=157225 RepID=A0A6N8U1T7_9STAP|nr:ABC transporter ATP-binding protein [Salinicoccus hispanicus]MXQ51297.1 ATP-binding cassette domain-containing protein [Salinicoccus hispanicus]